MGDALGISAFGDALCQLLDHEKVPFSREDWSKILDVETDIIQNWVDGKLLPESDNIRSVIEEIEEHVRRDDPALQWFRNLAGLPFDTISQFKLPGPRLWANEELKRNGLGIEEVNFFATNLRAVPDAQIQRDITYVAAHLCWRTGFEESPEDFDEEYKLKIQSKNEWKLGNRSANLEFDPTSVNENRTAAVKLSTRGLIPATFESCRTLSEYASNGLMDGFGRALRTVKNPQSRTDILLAASDICRHVRAAKPSTFTNRIGNFDVKVIYG